MRPSHTAGAPGRPNRDAAATVSPVTPRSLGLAAAMVLAGVGAAAPAGAATAQLPAPPLQGVFLAENGE